MRVQSPKAMEAARQPKNPRVPVNLIPLAGRFSERDAEVSGMTWSGNELLVLPQYGGKLGILPKSTVAAAVEAIRLGTTPTALEPATIDILPANFEASFPGFQGFEAVATAKGKLFFLVEGQLGEQMVSYLVAGRRGSDGVTLDLQNIQTLQVQTNIHNLGYEALTVVGDRLLAIPEANGRGTNPISRALVFDFDLKPRPSERLPVVDYRITDATDADASGLFWVSNYNHPGDAGMPEAPVVERLIALRATDKGIVTTGDTVDFTLPYDDGRNWESVVPFDRDGFLVMVDTYPASLLGYVFVEHQDEGELRAD